MVELSVLAGKKKSLKGVVTTAFGRRGLMVLIIDGKQKQTLVKVSKLFICISWYALCRSFYTLFVDMVERSKSERHNTHDRDSVGTSY